MTLTALLLALAMAASPLAAQEEAETPPADGAEPMAAEAPPDPFAAELAGAIDARRAGRPDEARTVLDAVLGQAPHHAPAHYQLGILSEEAGEREAALYHYGQAFTHDPRLLFADVNPHIIENALVLEALLLARRWERFDPPAIPGTHRPKTQQLRRSRPADDADVGATKWSPAAEGEDRAPPLQP